MPLSPDHYMLSLLRRAVPKFLTGDTVGFEWDVQPTKGIVTGSHGRATMNGAEFWYNINSVKGISYQEHYLQTRRMVLTEKINGKNINKGL